MDKQGCENRLGVSYTEAQSRPSSSGRQTPVGATQSCYISG